ncbi:hypothetical protein NDK50_22335 [Paraburkholderia bryophila]|nr:hypothetical protein [Paraburkholderia bryophila]WCM24915.1 hypothetical protein NDK50_22335 [Paraburkholderia bryophila]
MGGPELARQLKFYPALASIPIILISAKQEPATGPRYWTAFLRKPAPLDTLWIYYCARSTCSSPPV